MRSLFLFIFIFLFSFAHAGGHHHKRAKKNEVETTSENKFFEKDTTYRLLIYDRWGNMIYKDYGVHASWDGQAGTGGTSQQSTYIYIVYRNKEKLGSGTVTVIR
ncbi:MAG TPA: gliding motility-associated C-terminal domain-containing protein [Bacteroidia bacterium]|jgi:hypothetical protein